MPTQRTMPRLQIILDWRLFTAVAAMSTVLLALATAHGDERHSPPKPIDFAHDVAPLIKARCAECHTDGTYKGSFSLDTRETMLKSKAVVPGKSGESELIERVTSDDPEFRMPPKGARLTAERGRPAQGVDRPGSPLGSGVHVQADRLCRPAEAATSRAARRPRRPRPSRSTASSTPISPRTASRRPAPLDDAAFARRAFLDVIGLLPPPERARGVRERPGPRQARPADPPAARRPPGLRRSLADLLERPAPQRLRRDRLHRRRPQADHRLALSGAPRQQALRPVRPRADQPNAGIGGVHQRDQVAGAGQRQPGPRDPVLAERLAGVLRHQHEVRLVPRQLHRPLEARRRLRPGGRDRRRAAGDRPLRQADGPDRRAQVPLARAGDDRRRHSRATSDWSGWPAW